MEPDWVAGISIGAINAALIAGNSPERRLARLREFWERVSLALPAPLYDIEGIFRAPLNEASALHALLFGVPGFFTPRVPPPQLQRNYPIHRLFLTRERLLHHGIREPMACTDRVAVVPIHEHERSITRPHDEGITAAIGEEIGFQLGDFLGIER